MIRPGLTFDDVLLEPRKTAVYRRDTIVATRLSKKARLAIPLLAAASDTVSDARFAIALGRLGGMAVLHRNCPLEEQVAMVKQVKAAGLPAGAAVGPLDVSRAVALAKAGADFIFIDCAHAHAPGIIEAAKEMKRKINNPRSADGAPPLLRGITSLRPLGVSPSQEGERMPTQLVVGNVATKEAAHDFVKFADALKVGIGPGAICTTRIVSGVGVPQLTAIMDVVSVAKKRGIPVIADGGIRYSGDIVKALAAGASTVMIGQMFAGTLEAPGEVITENGKEYKSYRGMGSKEALEKRHAVDRYSAEKTHSVVEGVSGKVPCKGPLEGVVEQLLGGLRAGMGYIGAKTIEEMPKQARFIQITNVGFESHPHSLS